MRKQEQNDKVKNKDGRLVSTHVTRQAYHRITEEVKMAVVIAAKTMFKTGVISKQFSCQTDNFEM